MANAPDCVSSRRGRFSSRPESAFTPEARLGRSAGAAVRSAIDRENAPHANESPRRSAGNRGYQRITRIEHYEGPVGVLGIALAMPANPAKQASTPSRIVERARDLRERSHSLDIRPGHADPDSIPPGKARIEHDRPRVRWRVRRQDRAIALEQRASPTTRVEVERRRRRDRARAHGMAWRPRHTGSVRLASRLVERGELGDR